MRRPSDSEVRIHRMRLAAMAAWRRFVRRRKLPSYWPELALLDPADRAAVKALLRDRAVWLATRPAVFIDARRAA